MKTDYKPGDKVVVIKGLVQMADPERAVGRVLTIKRVYEGKLTDVWQVYFEESLGLDFEHIRPLTLLEKELLE